VTDEKPLSLLKEAFDELADVLPHFKFRAGGLAIGSHRFTRFCPRQ
jgi:hypothetical protein